MMRSIAVIDFMMESVVPALYGIRDLPDLRMYAI